MVELGPFEDRYPQKGRAQDHRHHQPEYEAAPVIAFLFEVGLRHVYREARCYEDYGHYDGDCYGYLRCARGRPYGGRQPGYPVRDEEAHEEHRFSQYEERHCPEGEPHSDTVLVLHALPDPADNRYEHQRRAHAHTHDRRERLVIYEVEAERQREQEKYANADQERPVTCVPFHLMRMPVHHSPPDLFSFF